MCQSFLTDKNEKFYNFQKVRNLENNFLRQLKNSNKFPAFNEFVLFLFCRFLLGITFNF